MLVTDSPPDHQGLLATRSKGDDAAHYLSTNIFTWNDQTRQLKETIKRYLLGISAKHMSSNEVECMIKSIPTQVTYVDSAWIVQLGFSRNTSWSHRYLFIM